MNDGVWQLGVEAVEGVSPMLGAAADLAERVPIVDRDAELLMHLAAGRVPGLLVGLDRAARQLPFGPPVGVADEEYERAVREHAFDAVRPRSRDEPIDRQHGVASR